MMYYTHIAFGLLVGLISLFFITVDNAVLFLFLVVFGSLLPDIDHSKSKVGKNVKIVGFLFEHRGFFHSLLATIFFVLIIHVLFRDLTITLGFGIGYLSHILLDMLNFKAVKLLFPLPIKVKGFMKTKSIGEYALFFVFVIVDVVLLWRLLF